jgi:hypothetical protein
MARSYRVDTSAVREMALQLIMLLFPAVVTQDNDFAAIVESRLDVGRHDVADEISKLDLV